MKMKCNNASESSLKKQRAPQICWQCIFAGERTTTQENRSSSWEFLVNCNSNTCLLNSLHACRSQQKLVREVRMWLSGWTETKREDHFLATSNWRSAYLTILFEFETHLAPKGFGHIVIIKFRTHVFLSSHGLILGPFPEFAFPPSINVRLNWVWVGCIK